VAPAHILGVPCRWRAAPPGAGGHNACERCAEKVHKRELACALSQRCSRCGPIALRRGVGKRVAAMSRCVNPRDPRSIATALPSPGCPAPSIAEHRAGTKASTRAARTSEQATIAATRGQDEGRPFGQAGRDCRRWYTGLSRGRIGDFAEWRAVNSPVEKHMRQSE
jgi:hypothetical protein